MTKKVKISFLILVWSIVAVQIFVNFQEKKKIAIETMARTEQEEDNTEVN